MKDFFISYNKADKSWAEWIAWTLEEAGYSVVIQAWDFLAGENFALRMQDATRETEQTIAILSQDYLDALFTQAEWAAAFARDPKGENRTLIPIRVRECHPEGLLGATIYVDLLGRPENEARTALLEGLKGRAKPKVAPAFPSIGKEADPTTAGRTTKPSVQYPGTSVDNDHSSSQIGTLSNLPSGVPFFTGREDVLSRIRETLKISGATALAQRQAISGLGGIGKTQTALEYARRHHEEYKALLWAVAESRESLISDFVAIAAVLNLPEASVPDQNFTVKAVKRWLESNTEWLLILDNADEPTILDEFLPEKVTGHVLLTSRAQVFDSVGILNAVELDEMTPQDARDFLLRRTGRPDLEQKEADAVDELSRELDYLPLALEQAGAYIKELRGSFRDYLASYQRRGLELLEKGHPVGRYRKSVRTTWSLNFQQVEQASQASADLLRVSAFLNPDRIPTELIGNGAPELGTELSVALANVSTDPIALDEVLQPLIQYSLIHRDRESRVYDMHRLVQTVLKDGMDEAITRLWAERVVKALASIFPDVDASAFRESDTINRLLPHAQAGIELVEKFKFEFSEAARLLNLAGRYLHLSGRLTEVEPIYARALEVREKFLGSNDLDLAVSLNNQAWLYYDQGKYADAQSLALRALGISESKAPEQPVVATSLARLGSIYTEQGRFADADRVYGRALEIRQKTLGPEHRNTADSLSNLASLYMDQGRNEEAESLLLQALKIKEKFFGPNHDEVGAVLSDLAVTYRRRKKLTEAETLLLRSIAIAEKSFGENFLGLGSSLSNLALVYIDQGRYADAEELLSRSLRIREAGLQGESPAIANSLSTFGYFYYSQGLYSEAEPLYVRALEIREKSLGLDYPDVAISLAALGNLYYKQRKYAKGEPLVRRAVSIFQKSGTEHRGLVSTILLHAALLNGLNRKGEAQRLEALARKIQAKRHKKRRK